MDWRAGEGRACNAFRFGFATAFALASACVIGCSQLLDFDGLSNGARSPSTSGGDGGTADATLCHPSQGAFCSTKCGAIFCSDFDGTDALGVWDEKRTARGAVAVNADGSRSSPNHALVNVQALTNDTADVELLCVLAIRAEAGVLSYSFDMRIDATDADKKAVVAAVWFGDETTWTHLQLSVGPDSDTGALKPWFSIDSRGETDSYTEVPVRTSFAMGEWVTVTWNVQIGDPTRLGGHSATLSINTAPSVTRDFSLTASSPPLSLSIGASYVGFPSTAWTLRYDNVVAEFAKTK